MFFPQNICKGCHNFIIAAHVLKEQILKTDAILIALAKEIEKVTKTGEMDVSTSTISEITTENAVFIINELDDSHDVKIKPELTIEGDQTVFSQTISDDEIEIKQEKESMDTPLDVEKMLQFALEKEAQQPEKIYEEWPNQEIAKLKEKPSRVIIKKRSIKKKPIESDLSPPRSLPFKPRGESSYKKSSHKKVHQVEPKKYKCKKCNFEGRDQDELLEHFDNSDKGCSEHECFICRKKFVILAMKNAHIMRDHKDACVNNECPHCNHVKKCFSNPLTYEKHLRGHIVPPANICVSFI